jgi:pre-mRNA-splicing factor CDC5/CEF1
MLLYDGGRGEANDRVFAAGAVGEAKKLRAGDIDPHPETKPARPDPIDMDEDEIEMLQEARARLANTQGKKAKRKAREKMLNEAKRLADLQKRRELKQAGLLSSAARTKSRGGKRSRREIDFGVEIPFHKPAPAGFHSTEEEDTRADKQRSKRRRAIDFKKINESQSRSRDREEKSAQKREENRLRALEKSNMAYVVKEVSKHNDPTAARKRGILSMPQPTITDQELEQVAKLSKEQQAEQANATMGGTGGATDALLGDYTDRPLPTPMRTPMTNSSNTMGKATQQGILREASNLRMLQSSQTPLLGGDNPELYGSLKGESSQEIANAATPMIGGGSATPMTARSTASATPMTITRRDELGLNRPTSQLRPPTGTTTGASDDVSVSATSFATTLGEDMTQQHLSIKEIAQAERRAAKQARKELEAALANLPAPQFEYEFQAPGTVTEDDEDENEGRARHDLEMDAEELDKLEVERLAKEAAKTYEERSSVVKRKELPRPFGVIERELVCVNEEGENGERGDGDNVALAMIKEEMFTLLKHDAFEHPVADISEFSDDRKAKGDRKKRKRKNVDQSNILKPMPHALDHIPEEALDLAKDLLEKEHQSLLQEKMENLNSSIVVDAQETLCKENIMMSLQGASNQVFLHDCGWKATGNNLETATSNRDEFATMKNMSEAIRKRAEKIESKLSIQLGGYMKRSITLQASVLESFAQLQNSKIEQEVFERLFSHEEKGMKNRMEKMQLEVELLEKAEAVLQKKYGDLLHERKRLELQMRKD